MQPCVSVIVPIYNVEKYLSRCIETLINQTLKNIEIILVNDGSPDNCRKICDFYSAKDNRIKIINKKNAGLGMARNSGIEVATGEYVAFVDSDDYVEIDMYEKLYTFSKKNDLDTCLCNFKRVNDNGEKISITNFKSIQVFENSENIEKIILDIIGAKPDYIEDIKVEMCVWRGIYSHNIIKNNEIKFCSEREFISEDIIFDLDYYPKSKRVGVIPDELYNYCENNQSLTQTYNRDRFYKEVILYKEVLRKIKIMKLESGELRLNRTFIGRTRSCIKHEVVYGKKYISIIKRISDICKEDALQEVLTGYPIKYLPYKQRIFSYFTKMKVSLALYILVKLKG